jgi:hypothetical protein
MAVPPVLGNEISFIVPRYAFFVNALKAKVLWLLNVMAKGESK